MKGLISEYGNFIGEIWKLNILNKLQGILYGPTVLTLSSWDMMHYISNESVEERKNEAPSFQPT